MHLCNGWCASSHTPLYWTLFTLINTCTLEYDTMVYHLQMMHNFLSMCKLCPLKSYRVGKSYDKQRVFFLWICCSGTFGGGDLLRDLHQHAWLHLYISHLHLHFSSTLASDGHQSAQTQEHFSLWQKQQQRTQLAPVATVQMCLQFHSPSTFLFSGTVPVNWCWAMIKATDWLILVWVSLLPFDDTSSMRNHCRMPIC